MGIYSNNRSGSMGVAQINANTSYGPTDIGRIMYECACNDQAVFEAVLLNDMRELKGLSEGTILHSEVAALNEASIKDYAKKAQEMLRNLWEKLKGAFKVAMQNISAYILRDGKAFAEKYKKVAAASTKSGSVTGTIRNTSFNINIPTTDSIEKYIRASKDGSDVEKKKVIGQKLAECIGESGSLTPKEFHKKAMEKAFTTKVTVHTGSAEVNRMLETLTNASSTIKTLSKTQKDAEKAIKAAGDNIKKTEKDAGNKDAVKTISILVAACQTVLSTATSTSIKIVKTEVSQSRKVLGHLMSAMKGEAEAMGEAAAMAGEDEVEAALDDTVENPADPEVDAVVAAAETEE